ncbi:MAG: glutamyl-tRNA reductase [Myxococcales bacterium]|nr:glutamyl-tRNA reductase [Myxococcales bacterium]MCB9753439.1 glutamyl-tRNA reductase [Myxococcales bacterium]
MSDELLAVGLNHRTAPVELRERLAASGELVVQALPDMVRQLELREAMIVSTCNRVEVYAVGPSWSRAGGRVLDYLGRVHRVEGEVLRSHAFIRGHDDAARHIFRVAASLESMVVGEPQILGQVKDAFDLARRTGTIGAVLDRCLTLAFRGAKRVRTETEIARGAASVPSVAVDLARSIFGELRGCGALLVGAGEMAQQSGVYLKAAGVTELAVVNRSQARGEALVRELGGRYADWGQLELELRRADIVISSTGASQPVIDRPLMKRVMRARRGAPVFLVDIAVPRDVDPEVTRLGQVFLYNIDDLQGIVHDNMRSRVAEAERAADLVEEEVAGFVAWHRSRAIGPLIRELQQHAKAIVEAELERASGKLATLDKTQLKAVQRVVHGVVQKMLHRPMTQLRAASSAQQRVSYDLVEACEVLFELRGEQREREAAAEEAVPAAAGVESSS